MRSLPSKFFVVLLITLIAGCSSIGPKVLNGDRYNYNMAMGYTNKQELLLNMVRLRYDEGPMVLKVGNISGSTKLERSAYILGKAFFPAVGPSAGETDANAGIIYTDNPIISYTPLDNKDYTTQFLKALDLSDIGLLLQSSWSIPRVFRVAVQRAGNAYNAPSSARPTSSHVPQYQTFIDMTYVLRRMQIADAVTGFYSNKNHVENLTLVINSSYRLTAKEKATLQKAGVEINDNKIVFTTKPEPHKTYVITRSMLGVLNYLSKGLLAPQADLDNHILTQTVYANGKLFDWQSVLRGMMKIYHSASKPNDASVSVFYRGRWYYIKDSDSDSKQTLILLQNIAGLTQTAPPGSERTPTLSRNT